MSIDRPHYDGPISFVCDDFGEVEETHCSDWPEALAQARSDSWRAKKVSDEWEHTCPDCSKEDA